MDVFFEKGGDMLCFDSLIYGIDMLVNNARVLVATREVTMSNTIKQKPQCNLEKRAQPLKH